MSDKAGPGRAEDRGRHAGRHGSAGAEGAAGDALPGLAVAQPTDLGIYGGATPQEVYDSKQPEVAGYSVGPGLLVPGPGARVGAGRDRQAGRGPPGRAGQGRPGAARAGAGVIGRAGGR